jgi:hypothetical protein
MKQRTQTYKDGLVAIYKVTNGAENGNMPKEVIELKEKLRYDELKVGLNRYWTAKQAQVNIDRLIRVPRRENVSTQDIAIPNDGKQYVIKQIQYSPEVMPPSMDLSLQRLENDYDVNGN